MKKIYFPLRCCSCLQPHEKFFPIKSIDIQGNVKITTNVEVPVCKKCELKMKKILFIKKVIFTMAIFLGFLIGSYIRYNSDFKADGATIFGILIGVASGYIISGVYKFFTFPVQINSIQIIFKNKDFQKLFEDMNGGNSFIK